MLWKRIPKAPNPCYCHTFEEQFTVTDVVESKAMCLGLLFYRGGLDQELELVEKIRLVLPKQEIIWLLFKDFYPFVHCVAYS